MSDTQEADRLFDQGDECSGKGARALQDGDLEQGHEWFRSAIDAYRSAIQAAPEEEVVLVANLKLCIGARHFGLGERDRSRACYEEAIASLEGRPDLTGEGEGRDILLQARLNRAELRLAEGDLARALAEIDEVLVLQPEHAYAVHLRERCEIQGGDG